MGTTNNAGVVEGKTAEDDDEDAEGGGKTAADDDEDAEADCLVVLVAPAFPRMQVVLVFFEVLP